MAQPAVSSKPLPVPGPIAGGFYFAAVTGVVLFRLAVKRYRLLPTVLVFCLGLQISAIVVVPLAVLIIRWRGGLKSEAFSKEPFLQAWLPRRGTLAGIVVLAFLHHTACSNLTELEIWQGAAGLEALAFALLASKLAVGQSAAGISAQKLVLDALRLSCRLATSLWLDHRLPRNSGNDLVRACDACSLLLVCGLLFGIFVRFRSTYQAAADSLRAPVLALAALALALVLRVNIGGSYMPDVLFTLGLYLEVVSPLPQLRLAAVNGGVVDEATSHHLAAIFGSRLLALTFWWCIRTTWMKGTGFGGWLILLAGVSPLILLSHYMCFYLRECLNRSLFSGVPLVCDDG